jgi:hypothetical protein
MVWALLYPVDDPSSFFLCANVIARGVALVGSERPCRGLAQFCSLVYYQICPYVITREKNY